jgi:chromosome segregation ATPase
MSSYGKVLCAMAGLMVLSSTVSAQQPQPASPDALVGEVRLLRQALERQATLEARVQLVVGRLTLQDQRVARAHAELQRSEDEVASLTADSGHIEDEMAELKQAQNSGDPSREAEVESQVKLTNSRLQESKALRARAEDRRNRAAAAIAVEEGRYNELQRAFDELDKELSR